MEPGVVASAGGVVPAAGGGGVTIPYSIGEKYVTPPEPGLRGATTGAVLPAAGGTYPVVDGGMGSIFRLATRLGILPL